MITAKPRVFKTHERKRQGKGFSRKELKEAGTSMAEAKRFGIPLDPRRKTGHEENVEAIKTLIVEARMRKKETRKLKDQKAKDQKAKGQKAKGQKAKGQKAKGQKAKDQEPKKPKKKSKK